MFLSFSLVKVTTKFRLNFYSAFGYKDFKKNIKRRTNTNIQSVLSKIPQKKMIFLTFHKMLFKFFYKFIKILFPSSCAIAANNYTDFGEFMARDQFYNSMQNQSNHTVNNSANSFPIGTFSIEQTTSQQPQSAFPTPDFFNPSQTNGMSNGGINGSGGGGNGGQNFNTSNANNSSNANNNNNGTDPSQATRETGIIEKLLVRPNDEHKSKSICS